MKRAKSVTKKFCGFSGGARPDVRPDRAPLRALLSALLLVFLLAGNGWAYSESNYYTSGYSMGAAYGDPDDANMYKPGAIIDYGPSTGAKTTVAASAYLLTSKKILIVFDRDLESAHPGLLYGGIGEGTVMNGDVFAYNGNVITPTPTPILQLRGGYDVKVFRQVIFEIFEGEFTEGGTVVYQPNGDTASHLADPAERKLVAPFDVTIKKGLSTLSALAVTQETGGSVAIVPGFSEFTLSYEASLPNDVSSITIKPTINGTGSVSVYRGNTSLGAAPTVAVAVGENKFEIRVRRNDFAGMAEATYHLTVNRQQSAKVLSGVNFTFSNSTKSTYVPLEGQQGCNHTLSDITFSSSVTATVKPEVSPSSPTVSKITVSSGSYSETKTPGSEFKVPIATFDNTIKIDLDNAPYTFQFNVRMQDVEASLFKVLLYRYDKTTGQSFEVPLKRRWGTGFDPNLSGTVDLHTDVINQADLKDAQFYIVPYLNENNTVAYIDGKQIADAAKSEYYDANIEGRPLVKVLTLARRTPNGEMASGHNYRVTINQGVYAPILTELQVANPDTGDVKFEMAESKTRSWNVSDTVFSSYRIKGAVESGQRMAIEIDGERLAGESFDETYYVEPGKIRNVVITARNTLNDTAENYTVSLENRYIPIEKVYIGISPETLAAATYPGEIVMSGYNGAHEVFYTKRQLSDNSWAYQPQTYSEHDDFKKILPYTGGDFTVPWSIYPAVNHDIDILDFAVGTKDVCNIVTIRLNEERSGGSLTFHMRALSNATFFGDKLPDYDTVRSKISAYVGSKMVGEYRAQVKVEPNPNSAAENGPIIYESPYVDIKLDPEYDAAKILPVIDPYFVAPRGLKASSDNPELMLQPHGISELAIQLGQKLYVPLHSSVKTYGDYLRLPEAIRERFDVVLGYCPFSQDPLRNEYLKRDIREREAWWIQYFGDMQSVPLSIERDTVTCEVEFLPLGIKKNTYYQGTKYEASDYIDVTVHDAPTLDQISTDGKYIRAYLKQDLPKDVTGIQITATTSATKQQAVLNLHYLKSVTSDSQMQGAGVLLSPKWLAFFSPLTHEGTSQPPNIIYISHIGSWGLLLQSITLVADTVVKAFEDLWLKDGRVKVYWKNMKNNQRNLYNGTWEEDWALLFSPNKTISGIRDFGWYMLNDSFNRPDKLDLGLTGDKIERSSGYVYPDIIGSGQVPNKSPAEVINFFRSHPELLPLVNNNPGNAEGYSGPHTIYVEGETREGGAKIKNELLLINARVPEYKENKSRGSANVRGEEELDVSELMEQDLTLYRAVDLDSSGGTQGKMLAKNAINAFRGDDVTVAFSDEAGVTITLTLDDESATKARGRGTGILAGVYPNIPLARDLVVEDSDGNVIPSTLQDLTGETSAKSSHSPRGAASPRSLPSDPSTVVLKFTVNRSEILSVEVSDVYFRYEGDAEIYHAKVPGDGLNGGMTMIDTESFAEIPADDGGGSGCASGAIPLCLLVSAAIGLRLHGKRSDLKQ